MKANEATVARAAEYIAKARLCIALTGAGVSTESGIPDFRSAGGLWERFDPEEYATIDAFRRAPVKVWEMLFAMLDLVTRAQPNPAHLALAELERRGFLRTVITQNIDSLHQMAGSKSVIEYHGNARMLQCLSCGEEYGVERFDLPARIVPRCAQCEQILKPAVVFFGEGIPQKALVASQLLVESADLLLVIGTSATVQPAASLPLMAREAGAVVVEFNMEETQLTSSVSSLLVRGKAGDTLPLVLDLLPQRAAHRNGRGKIS